MILSGLPQEIIEQIADLLSLKDKVSCSLASKSLKELFQNSMHSEQIVHTHLLKDLINRPQNHQRTYLKSGHLARFLYLACSEEITDKELCALQTIFPNIKYIYFEPGCITSKTFGVAADWNIWRLLTSLDISFTQPHIPGIESKLVAIILCLPLLRSLKIVNTITKENLISFTLNDFEAIHSHLKHLGHLKLSSNMLTLSESDLERMTKLSPATMMGNLDITSVKTDNRWLCYFARKYPNISTLKFCAESFLSNSEEQKDNTIALFNNVPLPFQHLKKLTLRYPRCIGKEYRFFWDIIRFHNIPLKDIWIHMWLPYFVYSPHNLCDIPKCFAEICLPEFSKTIESFYLACNSSCSTPIDFIEMKDSLYNLVKLDLKTPSSIEIDTLLCHAPRLKSLSLDFTKIKVEDKFYSSKRFELQSFRIHGANITSDVLRFLSFHCRCLSEFRMSSTSVYGNFTTPGCQFIDMTYSRLESLYINDTSFIIKENKKCPDNWNITLITQPSDDIPSKKGYDPKALPAGIGGPSIKAHYSWFCRHYKHPMYKISKARGSRVEKFVSNFEENKRIATERALYTRKGKPYVSWNNNCAFGYTKMKVGYVANCKIEPYI